MAVAIATTTTTTTTTKTTATTSYVAFILQDGDGSPLIVEAWPSSAEVRVVSDGSPKPVSRNPDHASPPSFSFTAAADEASMSVVRE